MTIRCYAKTPPTDRQRTIELRREELLHMTRRTRLDDGSYQTVCDCGWTSEPNDYDALGYVCGRAVDTREQQREEERAA